MTTEGSVTHLLAELKLGQADLAQAGLWRRYFQRLVGLARIKLGHTPRTSADEEDVINRRIADGRQPFGERDRRLIRTTAVSRYIRERGRLRPHRVGQFATPVPRCDVPEARQSVNKRPPVGVGQDCAVARDPDLGLCMSARIVEGVDEMGEIPFA